MQALTGHLTLFTRVLYVGALGAEQNKSALESVFVLSCVRSVGSVDRKMSKRGRGEQGDITKDNWDQESDEVSSAAVPCILAVRDRV